MFAGGEGRPPIPAQFNLRVAILGAVSLAIFSIIFLRLWYLQVLSGDSYLAEAQNNRIREITVQAPRGAIVDREGEVLVDNRTALELQVRPEELPVGRRRRAAEFERLGQVAGMSRDEIEREIRLQTKELPSGPVTLKRDVPYELVYFLRENGARFPGVSVERVFVRRYPQRSLGAHMFGYVREVSPEQLEEPAYQNLEAGDNVGQAGVELTYDTQLRGLNGATRVQVDATGRPTGGQLSLREPEAGNDLRLTIDSRVQSAGEAALGSFGLPGAFVAMDVDDGSILGLGSTPSFDPSVFGRPVITPALSRQVFGDPDDPTGTSAPIFNRAIQSGYPTGSTFKPITAVAALDAGLITPSEPVHDGGSIKVANIEFKNAGEIAHGTVDMRRALQVSSDVYFYLLGQEAEPHGGDVIQAWAEELGLGSPTGIDLPAESAGLVPTPEWRNELYKQGETDRPWTVGDSINLSVGQGDLQADPLQMAVAYAAIGNGGDVVRPHVAMRVEDPGGRVVQEIAPAPRRHVDIEPSSRDAIMDGLTGAAMEPGGTSYPVFGGFPVEIAGKTGTAERGVTVEDQSWYVALAPANDPQYVVAVTIERGGFGAEAAAPAAKDILIPLLDIKPRQIESVEASGAPSGGVYE
jgi:penicillin-binding protein 2